MAKRAKLLPCPFCGARAKTDEMEPMPPEIDHVTHIVRCSHATRYHYKHGTGCPVMAEVYDETPERAADKWNTRAVPAEERVASRCYSKRPCNFAVTGEAGETIKDIRARLGTGKPARMPTLAAAEGAARWVSELTGRTFVAEEAQ
jgi:hypothetical protein